MMGEKQMLMARRRGLAFIAVLSLAAVATVTRGSERWPRFQGPAADDLTAAKPPLRWSPTENIAWRAELPGYGQSSPVVWDGRVYMTSVSGSMKESCHVTAFDLSTGEPLWRRDFSAASRVENTNYVSKGAPTPAADGDGLIALFESGDLFAFTHEGKLRWRRNLVEDYGAIESRHGLASSLEQDEERVYVWMERSEAPYVLAISKASGETDWKTEGLGATSWSSPRLAPVGDGAHLVLSGIGKLAGLDPQSGKRLWEFDDISGNSTPTPLPLGEGRLLMGATEGRGDGGGAGAAASNGVVQIEPRNDGEFQASWLWRSERATSSFGSPIAHQGFAYFVNRAGVVYCLDLATGEERYARRTPSSIWATPIAIGERLYLFGRDGTTTVVKAGPEFEVLAENTLWSAEPSATPSEREGSRPTAGHVLYAAAAVDGCLLLRRGERLYSITE